MKKISLKKLNLKEVEKLSREQLKNVLGGWSGESGTDDGVTNPLEATCSTSTCYGWDPNTLTMKAGTCQKSVITGPAGPHEFCSCSAGGNDDCYA